MSTIASWPALACGRIQAVIEQLACGRVGGSKDADNAELQIEVDTFLMAYVCTVS